MAVGIIGSIGLLSLVASADEMRFAAGGAAGGAVISQVASVREHVADNTIALVNAVRRADYEGDLARLKTLYATLPVDDRQPGRGSQLRYWKGFAAWRRAINGFNESVAPSELTQDLELAIAEFENAARLDPGFVDAKIGLISCFQLLTFLNRHDSARVQQLVPKFVGLLEESLAAAPNNPRLLWVRGQSEWYTRPGASAAEIERRQSAAMATYARGLVAAREEREKADPLEPAWGEPELLMNLAWANLNRATPDINAAERYADEALRLVPHWRYVRDILTPQIRAKRQAAANARRELSGFDAREHVGETATVCGVVASTRYDVITEGHPTFLNLDQPFPKQSLTVVILEAERKLFGEPERRFQEKRICATGTIEELRQPPGMLRIVVTRPEQLREAPKR
jgi:hypothetical protein